ncbi:hypothetical protein BK687P6_00014 [Bacteroides phage BK687P6]|nr:hypothetical protein BK687P5_00016 [Bacteroides phage BK687P5]WAX07879.1 hypothetical protein BK687P6_00014 [Bacteroides phage BK687P6]
MEIYRKSNHDLLRVEKLQNGRLMSKSNGETKSFENYKQFAVHLYNKGFHIAMTDRSRQFAHNFIEAEDFLKLTDLILDNELAFRKDGDIFTGWFMAFKPDGFVELKSNTDFSYINELGYKAVTVRIDELIIIKGDI